MYQTNIGAMFSSVKEVDFVAHKIHNKLSGKLDSTDKCCCPYDSVGNGSDFSLLTNGANRVDRGSVNEHSPSPAKEELITVKPASQTPLQSHNCNLSMTPKRLFTGKNNPNSNSSPVQLSPGPGVTDLRDYFTITGNTPTSVGVVEIPCTTPTKPRNEMKKIPFNLEKKVNQMTSSSASTSDTKSSVRTTLTYPLCLPPKHNKSVQYGKRKGNKNLPKSKRHCQSNKMTNYFGTSPRLNITETPFRPDVRTREAMDKTVARVKVETLPVAGDECVTVDVPAVLKQPDQSDSVSSGIDKGGRRTPLKDRKNFTLEELFETVAKMSPGNSSLSGSPILPHNNSAIWSKVGPNHSILDQMKDYYKNQTSPYHKKAACYKDISHNKNRCPLQNTEQCNPVETIIILSGDESDCCTVNPKVDPHSGLSKEESGSSTALDLTLPSLHSVCVSNEAQKLSIGTKRMPPNSGKNSNGAAESVSKASLSPKHKKTKQRAKRKFPIRRKGYVVDLTTVSSPTVCSNNVLVQDAEKEMHDPSKRQEGSVIDLTMASPIMCGNNASVQDASGTQKGSLIDLTIATPSVCSNNGQVQDVSKRQKDSVIDLTIASPCVYNNNIPPIKDSEKDISALSLDHKVSGVNSSSQNADKIISPSRMQHGSVIDATAGLSSSNEPIKVQSPSGKKLSPIFQQENTVVHNTVSSTQNPPVAAEKASVVLQDMLIQNGVPLIMCSKLGHESFEGQGSSHKWDVPTRVTKILPVRLDNVPSPVLRDINIRTMAMKSPEKTDRLQAHTTTQSVNNMANGLYDEETPRKNVPQIRDVQEPPVSCSSGKDQPLRARSSHHNLTTTVNDVASSEQTRETVSSRSSNVSSSSSGSSSIPMSTTQLISYINEVMDKYQENPAKRLGLVAPPCLRRSTPCFHSKHLEVSKFFTNRLRVNARFELYPLCLTSCTNLCSRDRYLDVATLQWIVHFILNHGDTQLAVEAMGTLSTLLNGWPPCTPTAHLYYNKFLSEPYEYINSNTGLFDMLLLKVEGMFVAKKTKEFLYENDEDYPSNGESSFEDAPRPVALKKFTTCFQLISSVAAQEAKARKSYATLAASEQRQRLAAVLESVVHVMEQDMIAYLMDKDHDRLRGLTSPTKQPLVVRMVWEGSQSIRVIGTITTACRRIVKLYLLSSGVLRRPLARLVSLMAEVVANSELNKKSYFHIGPKCHDYAREILNMIPNGADVTSIAAELKPSWLALTINHLHLCRLTETDRPVSLEIVIACLNLLVNPLPAYECPTNNKKPLKVHKRNPKGETRLHIVCRSKNKMAEMSTLLSDPAINVNARDNAGWTPLHEAVFARNMGCIQRMLGYKPPPGGRMVDVKAKGCNGWTVLMEAASKGWEDVCEMFLKHSGWCLLEDKDDRGLTAMDVAKNPIVVKVLQEANTRYPHKTALSQPTLSVRSLTETTLSEVTRLVPAYVQLYLKTFQIQEITNLAKANAPVRNDVKRNCDYQDFFYGLKNMRTVKKLVKKGKRNPGLDPIVRAAFDIPHPLIYS